MELFDFFARLAEAIGDRRGCLGAVAWLFVALAIVAGALECAAMLETR